jgi:virginiamycin B lyase
MAGSKYVSKPKDKIDAVDLKIIGCLSRDCRASYRDISSIVGITPNAIKERINTMDGNKIGRFDPRDKTLIEYWVPSQNRLWGSCSGNNSHADDSSGNSDSTSISNNTNDQPWGIANVLQFFINAETNSNDENDVRSKLNDNYQNIWFTEWSENKIAKVNAHADDKLIPFSVVLPLLSINIEDNNSSHDVSFTFTPSMGLKSGQYTLMIGAENDAISYLRAIKLRIV